MSENIVICITFWVKVGKVGSLGRAQMCTGRFFGTLFFRLIAICALVFAESARFFATFERFLGVKKWGVARFARAGLPDEFTNYEARILNQ